MNGAGLIKKASTYLGKGWKTFCKAYGYSYAVPWCAIFVWYIFKACGLSKLFYGGLKVCNCRVAFNWCNAHLPKVKMADAKAGDIVFFTWSGKGNNSFNPARSIDHIGFIRTKGTSTTALTIEGNTNGSSPAVSKVANRSRGKAYVLGIFRPKYPSAVNTGLEDVVEYATKRAKEHHKYKVGGKSWETGIDCHGFTGACFGHCGYSEIKKRVWKNGFHKKFNTSEYLDKYLVQHNEKGLDKKKLIPGDIVMRPNKSMAGYHSAIYIGNGKVAEAVKKGTRIGKLTKAYTYAFRIPTSAKDKKTTATSTKLKGIDISYWQGKISKAGFQKAFKAGWKFTIIRIGYNRTLEKDSVFENNYKNALAAGMKVGVYYYSTALSVEQAKAEANYTLQLLKGRKLTYPVFIDFEDACQSNLGKDKSKKICEAFCAVIEKAGYPAGVYASYNFLTNKIAEINKKYYVWLAQYPKATYKGRYELHQYSSTTKVDGIGSKIDVDTSTLKGGTYPAKVTEETPKPKTKTVEHKATYEIVAKNGMNVRAKPTKYSTRIGGIGKGKKVKTSKKHGNWVYVPALKGWLCVKSGDSVYLKKK